MPPDIILADYQLDRDDTGIEAVGLIRGVTGVQVPAILITANQSKSVRQEAEANDISVMQKPAELARLRAMIDGKVRFQNGLDVSTVTRLQTGMQTKVAGD